MILIKDKLLRDAFNKIKTEMNDHLDTINENTGEINSIQSYLMKIENMINKLNERLDNIEVQISGKKEIQQITLTPKEQEIFLMLYSRTGDLLDYREISKSLGFTEKMAHKYTESMISKGIPIIKKYFDNKTYLILDSDFRNLHAKKNIVKIK